MSVVRPQFLYYLQIKIADGRMILLFSVKNTTDVRIINILDNYFDRKRTSIDLNLLI